MPARASSPPGIWCLRVVPIAACLSVAAVGGPAVAQARYNVNTNPSPPSQSVQCAGTEAQAYNWKIMTGQNEPVCKSPSASPPLRGYVSDDSGASPVPVAPAPSYLRPSSVPPVFVTPSLPPSLSTATPPSGPNTAPAPPASELPPGTIYTPPGSPPYEVFHLPPSAYEIEKAQTQHRKYQVGISISAPKEGSIYDNGTLPGATLAGCYNGHTILLYRVPGHRAGEQIRGKVEPLPGEPPYYSYASGMILSGTEFHVEHLWVGGTEVRVPERLNLSTAGYGQYCNR